MIGPMAGLLGVLAGMFLLLSVLAVGGGSSVIPELHKMAVTDYHWMTDRQFIDLFAITQATPGPGMLIVGSIGYKAGSEFGPLFGVFCAVFATLCMFGPCAGLAYTASRLYESFEKSPWHNPVQKGASAVTLGLIFATAYIIARGSDKSNAAIAVTVVTALLMAYSKFNPLLLMVIAGLLGYFGFVA